MDTFVASLLSSITTIIVAYFTFSNKLKKQKQEAETSNQNAITTAQRLLFEQIQEELTRRNKRIEDLELKLELLEVKIDKLESEKDSEQQHRQRLERENRILVNNLQTEHNCRVKIEKDFDILRDRVQELERENKLLKSKLTKIETGELKDQ